MKLSHFYSRGHKFFLALGLAVSLHSYSAQVAPVLVKKISIGSSAAGVAVNPATNRIYAVGSSGTNVIDGATNTIATTVPVTTDPRDDVNNVAVNVATNKIYIGESLVGGKAQGITVIDGATNTITDAIPAEGEGIAVNPTTNRIYATSSVAQETDVIDGATDTLIDLGPVARRPKGVAVNPRTNRIYVADFFAIANIPSNVTVIDGTNNREIRIPVECCATGVAVNPLTNRIYVTNDGHLISALDGVSSKVVAQVAVGNATQTGVTAQGIAIVPAINRIYVTDPADNSLLVLNGATNSILATIPLSASPQQVAVNENTARVYVTAHDAAGRGLVLVLDDSAAFHDRTPPTVAVTVPANGAVISSLPVLAGTATDADSGLDHVGLILRRLSDGAFWNGTAWVASQVELATTINGTRWERRLGLPTGTDLREGAYRLLAVAVDIAGNRSYALSEFRADSTPPNVTIEAPANGATVHDFTVFTGTVADANGIEQVICYLRRLSDGDFWTGSSWSRTPTALTTTISGNRWLRRTALPHGTDLQNGSYRLEAEALDRAGNRATTTSTVRVAGSSAAAVSAASPLVISALAVNDSTQSIQFALSQPLDPATASNVTHYRVQINGQPTPVESVFYNSGTRQVTLNLAPSSLHKGDIVTVAWQ